MNFLSGIDCKAAGRLVARVRPDLAGPVAHLATGCANHAYLAKKNYIARFPRNTAACEALRREQVFCAFVKGQVGIETPDQHLHHADDHPFSLHPRVGNALFTPANYAALPEKLKDASAENLATFFSVLHATDLNEARRMGAPSLYGFFEPDMMHDVIDRLGADWVRGFAHRVVSAFGGVSIAPEDFVFGHFDAHADNTSFQPDIGLHGIFDFADCAIGDYHREFHPVCRISTDLAARTMKRYEDITGRAVDRNRVRVYRTVCDVAELIHRGGTSSVCMSFNNNMAWWRNTLFTEDNEMPPLAPAPCYMLPPRL